MGRLAALSDVAISQWQMDYAYRPFQVQVTCKKFRFSRESIHGTFKPSNKSAVWSPYFQEVLINGIVQGRKQTHSAAPSRLSRRRMWEAVCRVIVDLDHEASPLPSSRTYRHFKTYGTPAAARKKVKADVIAVLGNWPRNVEDESFGREDIQSCREAHC